MIPTHQINFKDDGQDLLHVTASVANEGIGMITGVNQSASAMYRDDLSGMAIDLKDNPIGSQFNYANPHNGFRIKTMTVIVESIEKIDRKTPIKSK